MSDSIQALVIDDDRASAVILETLLLSEGMSATTIDHPAQLANIVTQLPDLRIIFVDLELPTQDGYEVLGWLRANLAPDILIAAYSVHTSESISAMKKGFNAFIGKPINRKDFAVNLRRILNREQVMAIS
ncbi:MAG: response regulator [Chloroflexota bacterium]|nr:response regulator [Chloroflexota bacterium]